jgi:acetyl esterase/lipase
VPIFAAPARCGDLAGLPPACSFVGGIDPFRDETVGYMERLRAAGIDVDYRVFEGCFHGFDTVFAKTRIAREAPDYLMTSFRHAVAHCFTAQPADKST